MRLFGKVRTRRPEPGGPPAHGATPSSSSPADRSPARAARMPRASSSVSRVSVRRMPERAMHAERDPFDVPRWLRRYGLMAWLFVGIVIVVAMAVFATTRIQAVFIAVFVALVITSVLYPVVSALARVMPRALATAVAMLGSLAVVAGIFTYVITSVAGQWEDLADQFSQGIDDIFDFLETGPLPIHFTQAEIYDWINGLVAEAQNYVSQNAGTLAGQVLSNAGAVALIFTVLALSIFATVFFLLRGGDMWRWFINQLPARSRESVHRAASSGWYTFAGYARGTVIIAFADGVLAFILLAIVGVPLAAPLAVLVFIGAFIPLIGAPAAMVIAAVVALAAGGIVDALIVTIGIALIGQIEGHLLQPLVMGRQVSLHPVVVALGVTAGTFLAGLLGAIIAIPVLAVLWAVYSALHEPDPPVEGDLPDPRGIAEDVQRRRQRHNERGTDEAAEGRPSVGAVRG
ncbi:AI-2E family transporter [Georgenia satyanarayanai]|uniref:AI-2E family transporter n=1 Tax=Georgenia satyanarayanai TaxID=860221 RepID=UPI00203B4C40|nr:AI-2E family transporter [Georgenia satyanarayanai]MCM3662064.1 AI-2E family transporter [Georgenia satyanarayanai]